MSHKRHNFIRTNLQFRKNYQYPLCRVAVRFSDTLLEHCFFLLVRLVNCGNLFHLNSRFLRRQVITRLSCAFIQLHHAFP